MTVTLEKLGGDTRNSFIEKLKESFDAFVEENPGTPEGPVISRGEIEASLNRPGTEAYWALRDGQRVGGIVLIIDAERARGDIELLFVVNGLKGKSVGGRISSQRRRAAIPPLRPESCTPPMSKRVTSTFM